MKDDHSKVLQRALEALFSLFSIGEGNGPENNQFIAAFTILKGVELLENLQNHPSHQVYQ